jgi:hypothetical protein
MKNIRWVIQRNHVKNLNIKMYGVPDTLSLGFLLKKQAEKLPR